MSGGEGDNIHFKRVMAALYRTRTERALEVPKLWCWELAEWLVGHRRYRLAKLPDLIGDWLDTAEVRLRRRRVRRGRWDVALPPSLKAKLDEGAPTSPRSAP